jgi:hypothetical protein
MGGEGEEGEGEQVRGRREGEGRGENGKGNRTPQILKRRYAYAHSDRALCLAIGRRDQARAPIADVATNLFTLHGSTGVFNCCYVFIGATTMGTGGTGPPNF